MEREEEEEEEEDRVSLSFVDRAPSLFCFSPLSKNLQTSRGKAALLEGDIPNLERLSRKGLRRAPPGTSAERAQRIAAVKEAVAALADGLHTPAKRYFSSSGGAGAGGGGPSSSSPSGSASSSTPTASSIQALKSKGKTVIMLDETKWGSRADADGYYSQSETAAGFRKVKDSFFFNFPFLFFFFPLLLHALSFPSSTLSRAPTI